MCKNQFTDPNYNRNLTQKTDRNFRPLLWPQRYSPVFSAPALHETNPNGAYSGEGIDGLEALVDGLVGELHKLRLVEDLEAAAGRNLDHRGQMPLVPLVAVGRLHEHRILAEALGEHLAALVRQLQAAADVVARHLDLVGAVDVGEDAEAEALARRRVRVAVDGDRVHVARHVEHLAHALLHLVVGQRAPVRLLHHRYRHHICVNRNALLFIIPVHVSVRKNTL